jgi:cytochrome c-type biogenesis protein CcmH
VVWRATITASGAQRPPNLGRIGETRARSRGSLARARVAGVVAAPLTLGAALTLAAIMSLGATGAFAGPAAAASHPSLPAIERQVMCVTCKIPLDVAESPQADRERAFIQSLIAHGETEAQIKRTLVGQYGPAVLALPSAHGFALAAYLVPVAAVLALLAALAVLLPRWRRRALARADSDAQEATLSSADAARLDADLARFD